MSIEILSGIGTTVALGATGVFGAAIFSQKVKKKLFPIIEQSYLSDTLDFSQVDDDGFTLIGRTGTLSRTYQILGKDHNICHQEDLIKLTSKRQYFWDRLAEEGVSLKVITQRERVTQDFQGEFDQPTLQKLHDCWMTNFKNSYINKHYLIIEQAADHKENIGLSAKILGFLKGKIDKKTSETREKSTHSAELLSSQTGFNKSKLEEVCLLIETVLSDYGVELLRHEAMNQVKMLTHTSFTPSTLLSFWARRINNQSLKIAPYSNDIAEHITHSRITFDTNVGIITHYDGAQYSYSAILTLNKWGEESSTLMMRELLSIEGQLILLHLLKGYPKTTALIKLEDKRRQQQLGFFSNKTQEELEAAKAFIEGDEASYWMYQLSVVLTAESIEGLQALVREVQQIFTNYGITAAREMAALEYVWRSQFPGTHTFLRPTYLLSHNLSHLMTFDRTSLGQDRSDWGAGALRYMKTVSGESYSLNLHVSEAKEALGHNLIIAPSGSGKTTLIQHLIAGALRHPDLRVFMFDRFNGTRIFTQACGGTYIDFKGKVPIQLNPFLMPMTSSNQQTLRNLLTLMAGINPDLDDIERILNLIQSLPEDQRILKNNTTALLNRHHTNYKDFKRWFDGPYAPWFNGCRDKHAFDALDLKNNRLIGFEMTDIMNTPDIVAPLTYYFNQRIKDAVYDQASHTSYPHWLFYDESAPLLANTFIRDQMVKVDLQEARKRRGVVTLCFQSVQSLIDTGVSNIVLDQCKTQFLFPNVNCKKETLEQYKHTFNLTDAETAFIGGEHPQAKRKPYSVLLKKPTESVILDCDLRSLGKYLNVYKSGTECVARVSQLQQQQETTWLETYLG